MTFKWIYTAIFATGLLITTQCKEEESPAVGFAVATAAGTEGDGTVNIKLTFGNKTTSRTFVTMSVGGSAAREGDYHIGNVASGNSFTLDVPMGKSEATFPITLIDDEQIEPVNDAIYFSITTISNDRIFSALTQKTFIYTITDNDVPPADGLRADLSWSIGEGNDVNGANFDLYLAKNVVLRPDGSVLSFETVDSTLISGIKTTGFESFIIDDRIPNGEYYIRMHYASGNSDAIIYLVLSQGDSYIPVAGEIGDDDTGKDFFYGPIRKTGNDFETGRERAGERSTMPDAVFRKGP